MATQNILEADSADSGASVAARGTIEGLWWKAAAGLLMCCAIAAIFLRVGPAQGFRFPDGARVLLFHVPCAWLATLAYVVAACYAAAFLRLSRSASWLEASVRDLKCCAAMELGLLFSILTTATGSVFAHDQWGAFWNWDPRETSIVVIMLIFAAYVILRGAVEEPELRARLSSVYALVAVVPGMFLIWVLPRIVETLHGEANKTLIGGQISGNYRLVMYGLSVPAFLLTFIWMFQIRVRLLRLTRRRDDALITGPSSTPNAA